MNRFSLPERTSNNEQPQRRQSLLFRLFDGFSPNTDASEIYDSEEHTHHKRVSINERRSIYFHETLGGARMTIQILNQVQHSNQMMNKFCVTLAMQLEAVLTLIEQFHVAQIEQEMIETLSQISTRAINFATNFRGLKANVLQEFTEMISELTMIIKLLSEKNIVKKQGSTSIEQMMKKFEIKHEELVSKISSVLQEQNTILQERLEKFDNDSEERLLHLMQDLRSMLHFLIHEKDGKKLEGSERHKEGIARRLATLVIQQIKNNREIQKRVEHIQKKLVQRCTFIVDRNAKKSGVDGLYLTLTEAIAAARDGDCIIVREGIYNEKLKIDKSLYILGSTSPDRCVICSSDEETICITAKDVVISHVSVIQQKNIPQKEGLPLPTMVPSSPKMEKTEKKTMQKIGKKSMIYSAIKVMGEKSSLSCENCLLSGGFGGCVFATNKATIILRGNRIYESKGNGISLYGEGVIGIIEDNQIAQHLGNGVCISGENIEVTIRNNQITDCMNNAISINNKSGQCKIEHNVISNNMENGVYCFGKDSMCVVVNNQIYEHRKCGIKICEYAEGHIENNELMRNHEMNIMVDETSVEKTVAFGNLEDIDLNIL